MRKLQMQKTPFTKDILPIKEYARSQKHKYKKGLNLLTLG